MISGPAFESGKDAGQRLCRLFAELEYELDFGDPPLERIESVVTALCNATTAFSPNPIFIGFLSAFMREDACSTDILNIWGLGQLKSDQSEIAPMCNMPSDSGLFAFADWTRRI